jgi:prophage regulatory protein
MSQHYLRRSDVTHLTGLSHSTLWRLEGSGRFPKRRKLSPGAVGWLSEEVEQWVESRCIKHVKKEDDYV